MIPQFCTNSREGVLLDFKIRFHYVKVLRFRRSGVVRVDPRKWEKQFLNVIKERQHSAEAVPRHKNGAKGNFSCLNQKPVQYGIRYPVSGIRYPLWFLRRNDNPVYCALVSV